MSKLLFALLATFFAATSSTAQPVEAQKAGSPKAEAAAEAKHLAMPHPPSKAAQQPEAQRSGSNIAEARAEVAKAKSGASENVEKVFKLMDGSSVYVFKDGKMAMEDKVGRIHKMTAGQVMKTADGQSIIMVGNEVARLDWVRKSALGGK